MDTKEYFLLAPVQLYISNEEVITNIQSKPFTLLKNNKFTLFPNGHP